MVRYFIGALCFLLIISNSLNAQIQRNTPFNRVMLMGDSWAEHCWNNKTYRSLFDSLGFADMLDYNPSTAIGGTTANYWSTPSYLTFVKNKLKASPTVDLVILSVGGNDMLAQWNTSMTPAAEDALLDAIENNTKKIIDSILSVGPKMNVLLMGYDYLNLVETVPVNSTAALLWNNAGQPTPLQANTMLSKLEARKIKLDSMYANVGYVQNMGLMQYVFGYGANFQPQTVPLPGQINTNFLPFPGGNVNFATPPVALNNNGTDPIHLSGEGFKILANHQSKYYFDNIYWHDYETQIPYVADKSQGTIDQNGIVDTTTLKLNSSNGVQNSFVLSFSTKDMFDTTGLVFDKASIFLKRKSATGLNLLDSLMTGVLGTQVYFDIKKGSFGNSALESTDLTALADTTDAGSFSGTVQRDGYNFRIDVAPAALKFINTNGLTQFRVRCSTITSTPALIEFFTGSDASLAPRLFVISHNVIDTVPPPPVATATLSGSTSICKGDSAQITIKLTGTPPFLLYWTGEAVQSTSDTLITRTVNPVSTTAYGLDSLLDANGTGIVSGSVTITFFPVNSLTINRTGNVLSTNHPEFTLWNWFEVGSSQILSDSSTFVMGADSSFYTVTAIDTNGCTVLSDTFFYAPTINRLVVKTNVSVSIYPNPVQSNLTIKCSQPIETVQLCNALGQNIKLNNFATNKSNEFVTDLSSLPKGVYYLQVNGSYSKIIKE